MIFLVPFVYLITGEKKRFILYMILYLIILIKSCVGPDGLFEGDWVCPKCENVNFAFRTTCNMKKCGAPRPASVS